MARPKSKPKGKAKVDKPLKIVGVRSSPEWAEWVEGLADHYRTTVAGVIDRALTEWAKEEGYPTPPPRRVP